MTSPRLEKAVTCEEGIASRAPRLVPVLVQFELEPVFLHAREDCDQQVLVVEPDPGLVQGEDVLHVPPLELGSVEVAHVQPVRAHIGWFDDKSNGLERLDAKCTADQHLLVLEAETPRVGDNGVGKSRVQFIKSAIKDPVLAELFGHATIIIECAQAECVGGRPKVKNGPASPEEFLHGARGLHGSEVFDGELEIARSPSSNHLFDLNSLWFGAAVEMNIDIQKRVVLEVEAQVADRVLDANYRYILILSVQLAVVLVRQFDFKQVVAAHIYELGFRRFQ